MKNRTRPGRRLEVEIYYSPLPGLCKTSVRLPKGSFTYSGLAYPVRPFNVRAANDPSMIAKKLETGKMLITFHLKTFIVAKKNRIRAGISKGGKLYQYTDNRSRACQTSIRQELFLLIRTQQFRDFPLKNPVKVTMVFDRHRADAIGIAETVLDTMQGLLIVNDRQVVQLEVTHLEGMTQALVNVEEI